MRKLTPTTELKDLKFAIEAQLSEMTTELRIAVKKLKQSREIRNAA